MDKDPRDPPVLDQYAPRFGPSRGEEWALHGVVTRARALVIMSQSLRNLAAQSLPEELVHDLLPEIDSAGKLLAELHAELKSEIINYRAARAPQDGELDGL